MTAPTSYVVPLTPPGRGAVAVVLVSGPDALAAVDGAFSAANGKPLADQPTRRAILGRWGRSLESPGEELVVCRRADDRVEVHPHGGVASVTSVIDRLTSAGCMALNWKEWIAHDEPDPIRAAARIALAGALTERTAAILLDQYHGALHRALEDLGDLASGRCKPAVTLPHTSHVLPSHHRESETPTADVDALLARADLGLHLTQPWRVVVAGPPNVGKSSLVNAILGFTRAIVHDQPGTTRDIVTATTAMDGWPVELVDTAGLHDSSDAVEAVGIEYARRQLAEADLVVWVEDAADCGLRIADCGLSSRYEREFGGRGAGRYRWLRVSNKIDLMGTRGRSAVAAGDPQTVLTSAVTGQGIPELVASIVSRLVPDPPPPGAAVPFTDDQIAMLQAI